MDKNSVELVGYVGADPIIRLTKSGDRKAIIKVGTHYPAKKGDDNKSTEYKTVWHWVIAWKKWADYAERNFISGSKIMVEGSIVYRDYLDKTGNKVRITDIRAETLRNLDR